VELVLPGAYYLVRMLDGRIDTQGTVKELQAQGYLKGIAHDAVVETHKEELAVAETASISIEESLEAMEISKKPRKLVKDEHREVGAVKWSIYKSYLRASSVFFPTVSLEPVFLTLIFYSSYQIWVILVVLVVINQFWGITEKLWIKVFDFFSAFLDINLIDHLIDLGRSLWSR
jgi:hypothetical protein